MSEEDFASRNARETSAATPDGAATGFTPGPWVLDEACICSVYGTPVAQTCRQDEFWTTSDDDLPETELARIAANARLIAAAPDLYEACREAKVHLTRELEEPGRTVFWRLVDALAKADGRGSAERVAATPAELGPGTNNNV
jgi:hypothetical protein